MDNTDTMIVELASLHSRLGKLLANPQPGLTSWLAILSGVLTEMALWSGSREGVTIGKLNTAAPDLLAALKAIEPRTFGHSKFGCKGKARDPENCETCKAIWAARDAIAKATGQSY